MQVTLSTVTLVSGPIYDQVQGAILSECIKVLQCLHTLLLHKLLIVLVLIDTFAMRFFLSCSFSAILNIDVIGLNICARLLAQNN